MIARLTDEPKRLVEMKADVSWPASVQSVMDKALQRDAELRYSSASEFGRDLYAAVAAMPESGATSAFTAVMNKLSTPEKPAVAIPSPPRASATRTLPPTRVNRASSRDMAAPAGEKKGGSRGMMGVLGLIGFLAIAGGMWALGKFGGAGTDDRPPETSGGNVAPPSTPAIRDLSASFAQLDSLTDPNIATLQSAGVAQAKVDSLEPLATVEMDRVRLQFYRAMAHLATALQLADGEARDRELQSGCNILKRNEGKLDSTTVGRRVRVLLYGDSVVDRVCDSA
jgi:hypothetical protein